MLVLPFMVGGTLPLPGLFSYINRWEFNGGLFQLCVSILNILEVKEYQWLVANFSGYQETIYINYAFYYKVCAVILFAGVLFDQLKKLQSTSDFKSNNFIQKSFLLTAVFLPPDTDFTPLVSYLDYSFFDIHT